MKKALIEDLIQRVFWSSRNPQPTNWNVFLSLCQEAHWLCLDFLDRKIKFMKVTYHICRYLQWPTEDLFYRINRWRVNEVFRLRCGGLLLRRDQALLVQGYSGRWSFPVGKKDGHETADQCMIRELHEEIGFSVCDLANTAVLRLRCGPRSYYLRVFSDIPPTQTFQSKTRYEIKDIAWVPLRDLHFFLSQDVSNQVRTFLRRRKGDG